MALKPFYQVPIVDCGEALVPIPVEAFSLVLPHPYEKLGAPYAGKSPFFVRQGVLQALVKAQAALQQEHSGWRIQIFDAYRPIAVQQFMVDYTFRAVAQAQGRSLNALTANQRQEILEQVYEFWAVPSLDPKTPPPHSTGAAVDVTLVNQEGQTLEMGSAIDELSPRSYPNHFVDSTNPNEQQFHQHRRRLRTAMLEAGFQQHPNEWWHFCLGDQMWAWLTNQMIVNASLTACYGSI